MFGFLYLLTNMFFSGASKVSANIEDNKNREKARQNGDYTYSYRSDTRLTSNGRSVWHKTLPNGHHALVDGENGNVYIDYTQNRINQSIQEAVSNGQTVRNKHNDEFPYSQVKNYFWFKCGLSPFRVDIKTGHLVHWITINHIGFYMDLNTELLVRVEDNATYDTNRANDIMQKFNKRQADMKKDPRYGKDRYWGRYEYFTDCKRVQMDEDGNFVVL